jgi:hypothetical protein
MVRWDDGQLSREAVLVQDHHSMRTLSAVEAHRNLSRHRHSRLKDIDKKGETTAEEQQENVWQ